LEIAALISLLDAAVSGTTKIVELIKAHNAGQQPTPDQLATAKQETADLLQRLHDLLPPGA
jgi:hypothetical protein